MPIQQPSNQIKLTNVSIVRQKKGKKRFELACYKNKVMEYRTGVESDLDEVLQIHQIFTNVSKGQVAPHADIQKAYPGKSQDEIILEILKKGELQVGEKERGAEIERKEKEVINIVVQRCVEPKSKRVYTPTMIEKALNELRENPKFQTAKSGDENNKDFPTWHGVSTSKNAKALALEAIKALVYHQPIAIARAQMKVRIFLPAEYQKKLKDRVKEELGEGLKTEDISGKGDWECEAIVDPGVYRTLSELFTSETKGRGRVEVLDTSVVHES
ncbi:Shwachman-Bodian-diamond syndrome protein [Ascobolus immersus RN42]|uniref:Ribosome maturation protein SDO1 n=1 Tax=Ascobolus immersus RN42 TaxID=1160509 RepID=A0A3N4HVD1_ASCIM|nr:Shwachman-Bodian-diamond syndrome protein [Ascobolus immersus RN42]